MKAKTFLLLGIVAVLAVLSTNTASAQKGVVKVEFCGTCNPEQPGCENPCVPGEYVVGTVCSENLFSNHNWVTIDHGGIFTGYIKEGDNWVPSGNVYTTQGVITGELGKNEIFTQKLFKDGKLHSMIRWRFHVTTNANGEVTAYMDKWDIECK
jgi:hypothetical protein